MGNREGIITDSFPQAGHVQGPVYTAAEEQWLAPMGAQDEAQKEDTGDDTDPDMPELLDGDASDEEEQVTSEPEVPLRKQWTRSVEPPTPRTRAAHRKLHIPFASWCRICVSTKGKAKWRRRRHKNQQQTFAEATLNSGPDVGLPLVEFDYWFPGLGDGQGTATGLIAIVRESGYAFAFIVSSKGASDNKVNKELLRWLSEAGVCGSARFRSDGETAIQAFVQNIAKRRGDVRTVIEIAPRRTNGGLGSLNRYAVTLGGQVRAVKLEVEERLDIQVRLTSFAFSALVSYSSWQLNRFQPWHGDEKKIARTPYEIVQHKPYTGTIFGFGEPIMARIVQEQIAFPKLLPRWIPGLSFGRVADSDEYLVASADGMRRLLSTRDVQPIDLQEFPPKAEWSWWFVSREEFAACSKADALDTPTEPSGIGGGANGVSEQFGKDVAQPSLPSSASGSKTSHSSNPFHYQWETLPSGEVIAKRTFPESQVKHGASRAKRTGHWSPWNLRLRAFHRDCGQTPDCRGCETADKEPESTKGLHHSSLRMHRQAAWQQTHGTQLEAKHPDVEPTAVQPDVTMKDDVIERGKPTFRLHGKTPLQQVHFRPRAELPEEEPKKFRHIEVPEESLQTDDRVVKDSQMSDAGDASVSSQADTTQMQAALDEELEFELQYLTDELFDLEDYFLGAVFGEDFYDDVTGKHLDSAKVEVAKQKERDSLWSWPVFERITYQQAREQKLRIIRSRWVITEKNKVEVKARLVACELAFGRRLDCWAGTPMTVTHRLLLCLATKLNLEATVGDAKTAFLNAELPQNERVAIVPPPGEEPPGVLYLIIRALYGLRKSPAYFQEWLAEALRLVGWRRCILDPCLFVHDETGSLLSHHADDILLISDHLYTSQLWSDIEQMLIIRHDFPALDHCWRPYLGRLWRRVADGWQTKMKPGYFTDLLASFDLLTTRPVSSPCWTETKEENLEEPTILSAKDQTKYRMGVGKLAWSLPCRPECSYPIKELARHLQAPSVHDMEHLVRVLKFIAGTQHWILHLKCSDEIGNPRTHVDSNWTSSFDGKSTSGIVVMWCEFLLLTVSKTQSTVAQSSCEAEILASNAGAVEGMFVVNLLEEIGISTVLELCTDSSSGLMTLCRRGPGRMRHLRTKELWLQEEIRQGNVRIQKIASLENYADLFTKLLGGKEFRRQAMRLGLEDESQTN